MFKFLKGLMGKKDREETVAFSFIDEWFNNKLKETEIRDELNDVFDSVSIALKNINNSLVKISTQIIQGIPEEHKVVAEEHIGNYVSSMKHYVKQLTYRETRDFNSIINFDETLSAALQEIEVLKEFVLVKKFNESEANELLEAFNILKEAESNLDNLIRREHGLLYVSEVKKKINAIDKKYKRKLELQSQIERETAKKNESEAYKAKLETDSDDLKTTESYEKYDKMQSRKIHLETEKERTDAEVKSVFQPLAASFKKYDSMEMGADRAIARAYAEDVVRAFYKDEQLWVLSLMQSVSNKLPELEADEAKRMKLRQTIVSISEDSLRQMLAKNRAVEDGLRDIRRQLTGEITARKLEDIKYKINHAEQQIKNFDESILNHQKEIDGLKIEKDLLSLEKELSSFAKVKIQ